MGNLHTCTQLALYSGDHKKYVFSMDWITKKIHFLGVYDLRPDGHPIPARSFNQDLINNMETTAIALSK
jgi:hypothetical protein